MAITTFGLSCLHEAASSSATAPCFDIVLVHEFGGHPARTWQPVMGGGWPDARVFTFGYNDTLRQPYGRKELSDHAERLLLELSQRRVDDTRLRPIVFITRGAGGIIVKKALITARLDTRYRDIGSLTLGVVFEGLVHEATDMSRGEPTRDVWQSEDAEGLKEISAAFVRIPGLLLMSDMKIGPAASKDPKVTGHPLPSGPDGLPASGLLFEVVKRMQELPEAKSKSAAERGGGEGEPETPHLRKPCQAADSLFSLVALSAEFPRVLQLLRPHKVRQEQVSRPPTPGTCSWIEGRDRFKEWLDQDQAKRLLWIYGDMGCGKTYLGRYIVGLVSDPSPSKDKRYQPQTVAYCCLGDMAGGYRTPESVLAWLLHDLLVAQPELAHAARLKQAKPVCDLTPYEAQQLWGHVVAEATKGGRRLTLVVDEVDKLDIGEGDPNKFFECITCRDLSSIIGDRVWLLVLSRPQPSLEAALRTAGFSQYRITPEDTTPDIEKTTKEVLDVVGMHSNGSTIADDIKQQIKTGASGMYLWARVALDDAVKRLVSGNGQSRDKLATGIFPLFEQFLGEISKGNQEDKGFLQNIIFWLTYQAERMREPELLTACALVSRVGGVQNCDWDEVDSNDPEVDAFCGKHQSLTREVRDRCAPLVRVWSDGLIGAVHHSLREYLRMTTPPQSPHPNHGLYHCNEKNSNKNISLLCADYLFQRESEAPGAGDWAPTKEHPAWPEKVEERVLNHPFIRYASLFWIYHARISGSPFDADLAQWNEPRHRRLLDIQDGDPRKVWWTKVWWGETTGGREGFPKSASDLRASFPDEGLRLDDGEKEYREDITASAKTDLKQAVSEQAVSERAALARAALAQKDDGDVVGIRFGAEGGELGLALEVEAGLAGLMRWMDGLKEDVGDKIEKCEQTIKKLQGDLDKWRKGVAGTGDARTSVAGTGFTGTGFLGTGFAGTGLAGTGFAGTGLAGTGNARTGLAGTGDAGTGGAGAGDAATGDAGTGVAGAGAGTGDAGTGGAGAGDVGTGVAGAGTGTGDAGTGDAGTGVAGAGAGTGDAGTGGAGAGDVGTGVAGAGTGTGDAGTGLAGTGVAGAGAGTGDAGTGLAGTGIAGTGAGAGDAGTGLPGTGDAGTGDTGTGDAGTGDAGTGVAGAGAGTGDTGAGFAGAGLAGTGDAATGLAGTGGAGTGNAETGGAGTGDAATGVAGTGAGTGIAGAGIAGAGVAGAGDAGTGDAVAGMVAKIRDLQQSLDGAKEDLDNEKAKCEKRALELKELGKRYEAMLRSMLVLEGSLGRSIETLKKQKSGRSSWIPFLH
ncbi:hypothetical protein RB600_000696 [Gaeumannomyces tritici]